MTLVATGTFVLGAGGHGRVVVDLLNRSGREVAGFLDHDHPGDEVEGLPVIHPDRLPPDAECLLAIGDNWQREQLAKRFIRAAPAAVHPSAVIGEGVRLGAGTVVMAGAIINCGTVIAEHCIVNTGASIDHDCVLEPFSSVAPGATIGGNVTIGRGAAVCLGASVIHERSIGAYSVVGAGAVAVEDVPPNVVAYGVPARVVRRKPNEGSYL